MKYVYQVLLSSTVQLTSYIYIETKVSLITTHCLRLFVVVYRVEMLYIASEVMVSDTCVPSLIIIRTATNQLVTKVSLKINCCLRLYICCWLQTCNVLESKLMVGYTCSELCRHNVRLPTWWAIDYRPCRVGRPYLRL